jgi:hypothetical protein
VPQVFLDEERPPEDMYEDSRQQETDGSPVLDKEFLGAW